MPGSAQPLTPVFISCLPLPDPCPTDDPVWLLQQLGLCPFLHTLHMLSRKWLDFAVLPLIPVTVLGRGQTDKQSGRTVASPLAAGHPLLLPDRGRVYWEEGTILCVLVQVSQRKGPTHFCCLWREIFLSLVTAVLFGLIKQLGTEMISMCQATVSSQIKGNETR